MGKTISLLTHLLLIMLEIQKYYSCKRGTVAGLNFNFVGMAYTSAVAYMVFNVGLFWIPQVQVTYNY